MGAINISFLLLLFIVGEMCPKMQTLDRRGHNW